MLSGLRLAIRSLRKTPGFTATAMLTMAVAIGSCAAVFSLLQAVILRPLPYADADSLYNVWSVYPERSLETSLIGGTKYESLFEQPDVFTDVAMLTEPFLMTWRYGSANSEMAPARYTSVNLLSMLGTGPFRGRDFTVEEGKSHAPVVMIGHALWHRHFGADENIIGRSIAVDGISREIVGVLPPSMQAAFKDIDLLIPSRAAEAAPAALRKKAHTFVSAPSQVIVRLAPNVTPRAANARLAEISKQFRLEAPRAQDADSENVLHPLKQDVLGEAGRTLWLLAIAVGAVMLIACANVANLFLARHSAAWKDVAVRFALGASRGAILRQFFVESALLTVTGAALGVLFAWFALRGAIAFAGDHLPRASEVQLNIPVLLVCLALSLLSALLVCVYPAWLAARTDVQSGVKESGRGAAPGSVGKFFREGLVVAQVGLSQVLLCCAGLLAFSLYRLLSADMGFATESRAVASVTLPSSGRYNTVEASNAFYRRLEAELEQAPEFAAAGAVSGLPLSGAGLHMPISIMGQPALPPEKALSATIRWATPGYFPAMNARLRTGRLFTSTDRPGAEPVAIVNETLAKRAFPQGSAIGQRVAVVAGTGATIVGVMHDLKTDIDGPVINELYIARDQLPMNIQGMSIVVLGKPGIAAEALVPAMQRVLRKVDADIALHAPRTMSAIIGESVQLRSLAMTLLVALAGIAVLLAVVGLYAVLAYAVSQRTPEIGVRMALGAQRSQIVSLVLSRGLRLVAVGLALGLLACVWSTRLTASMLYQVEPLDPFVIGSAVLLFGFVALCACVLPSLRASRIDPLAALRSE